MSIDNFDLPGLDSVGLCNDSAMAIPDKAGMTEALKSADSSHFGDRAHLFPGLTERGRNIRDQNNTEALALTRALALPQPFRVVRRGRLYYLFLMSS